MCHCSFSICLQLTCYLNQHLRADCIRWLGHAGVISSVFLQSRTYSQDHNHIRKGCSNINKAHFFLGVKKKVLHHVLPSSRHQVSQSFISKCNYNNFKWLAVHMQLTKIIIIIPKRTRRMVLLGRLDFHIQD